MSQPRWFDEFHLTIQRLDTKLVFTGAVGPGGRPGGRPGGGEGKRGILIVLSCYAKVFSVGTGGTRQKSCAVRFQW